MQASQSSSIDQLFVAQSLLRDQKYDEALLAFAEYVHVAPKDMSVYRLIAQIYGKKGMAEEKLISFRRQIKDAIDRRSSTGSLFEQIAMATYDLLKDAVIADKFWQFALEKLPANMCTHNNYADFLLQCGRYSEALPYAMTATAGEDPHGIHFLTLGEIYVGLDQQEKARHIYEKLQEEYPAYAARLHPLLTPQE